MRSECVIVTALLFALTCCVSNVFAETRLFDMGKADSNVWEGATAVTAASVYSQDAGFGWESAEGLKEQARVYAEPVFSKSRGREQPPVMYTNAITEDCIIGEGDSRFLVDLPNGEYHVYVMCGTSDSYRNQYWDFGVAATDAEQAAQLWTGDDFASVLGEGAGRVQIEGGYTYRVLNLRALVTSGKLAVSFQPHSKWLASAVLIYDDGEAARVEKEIIKPLEDWTFFLPPAEAEKWTLEPPPETGAMPALSDADRQRGYVIFHRPWPECVYPNMTPRPEETNPELRIFASPGEYEPLTVSVRALRDLEKLMVTVSDLGPIAAADIDVRHVKYMKARPNYTVLHRYRIVPDVLEPFEFTDVPEGETDRFWLTVRVPEDAQPGIYTGSIKLAAMNAGEATVPVKLRVLPIKLQEDPEKIYGIYYRHPIDRMLSASDEVSREYFRRQAELEAQDLVAHGIRNVTMSAWMAPADENGEFHPDWTGLEAKLELAKRYNFKPPFIVSVNTGGIYRKYMKESYGSHLRMVKIPPPEFAQELTAMCKVVEAERVKRGWPEFLYYPIDEPGRQPEAVEFMKIVLKAVKDAGVRTYLTADPTADAFQPWKSLVDVWCTQPFAPDRETVLSDSAARGVEYWCYPNHVAGENDHTPVAGARMTFGFGFWRSGFRTLIPWIYCANIGDPFNYLTGSAMDFMNRHEPDGAPMPVALWEAYREGYDDYRYVYTLQQLVEKAKASDNAAARQAATRAEKELQYVWDSIQVQPKYKYDDLWPAHDFDVYRWIVAEQILKVQTAMGG